MRVNLATEVKRSGSWDHVSNFNGSLIRWRFSILIPRICEACAAHEQPFKNKHTTKPMKLEIKPPTPSFTTWYETLAYWAAFALGYLFSSMIILWGVRVLWG